MVQIDFKAAIEDFKTMNLFEKIYVFFFIAVIVLTLQGMMFESGPMYPVTSTLNYYQALLIQQIFGGELVYHGELTIVIICLVAAIPIIVSKYLRKKLRR